MTALGTALGTAPGLVAGLEAGMTGTGGARLAVPSPGVAATPIYIAINFPLDKGVAIL